MKSSDDVIASRRAFSPARTDPPHKQRERHNMRLKAMSDDSRQPLKASKKRKRRESGLLCSEISPITFAVQRGRFIAHHARPSSHGSDQLSKCENATSIGCIAAAAEPHRCVYTLPLQEVGGLMTETGAVPRTARGCFCSDELNEFLTLYSCDAATASLNSRQWEARLLLAPLPPLLPFLRRVPQRSRQCQASRSTFIFIGKGGPTCGRALARVSE